MVNRNEYLIIRLINLLEIGDITLKEAEIREPYLAIRAMVFKLNLNISNKFSKLR